MARRGPDSDGSVYANDKPDGKEVAEFHTNDDVDVQPDSHHHTLGPSRNQAASGAHTHRGDDSALLFEGRAITGSRTNGTALQSVIAMLVELGAEDSTTP